MSLERGFKSDPEKSIPLDYALIRNDRGIGNHEPTGTKNARRRYRRNNWTTLGATSRRTAKREHIRRMRIHSKKICILELTNFDFNDSTKLYGDVHTL